MLRKRNLPPLNSLKAFEAAARLGSVSKASEELSVSPSAVSQQLKILENWLEVPLLIRQPNRILLTEAGQDYLTEISTLLDQLDRVTDRLIGVRVENRLKISVVSSFASEWLMPRLSGFRKTYPKIQLELLTTDFFAEFDRDGIDLAIRYGAGDYPGLVVEPLLPETLGPVAHSDLLRPEAGPVPMLVDSGSPSGMVVSLEQRGEAGLNRVKLSGDHISFSDAHIMYQAALQGEGITLGRSALVARYIEEGRLVCLTDRWEASEYGYFLVHPGHRELTHVARLFSRWLHREASDFLADLSAPLSISS